MPVSVGSPRQYKSVIAGAYGRAAMLIWPRLNQQALERCCGDPRLIAAYVARRTSLSTDVIVAMLEGKMSVASEPSFYFG
jgi:hypothetical protein